jgi:hypothetical protein
MRTLLLISVLLFCTAPLMAQQPDKKLPPTRPAVETVAEDPLPRPMKLSFRFEPVEPQDKPLWVLVSTPRYLVDASYAGKEAEFQMRVEGRVRPASDKFLFTYAAQVHFSNADANVYFGTEGSTKLTPGKEKQLAILGERALMVLLSYDESEK